MSNRRLTVKKSVPDTLDRCPSISDVTRGFAVNEDARGDVFK
jgi:hypothetical protein